MKFLLLLLIPFLVYAGPGTFPQGDHVKNLKDKIEFKNTHTQIISNDSDNPELVPKSADMGSLYLMAGTGWLYRKTDNGSTTNWLKVLDTSILTGSDNMVALFNGNYALDSGLISQAELELLDGMLSVSTGVADNDKLITQGYSDDAITTAVSGTDNMVPLFNGVNAIDASIISQAEVELLDGIVAVTTGATGDNTRFVTQGYVTSEFENRIPLGGVANAVAYIDIAAGRISSGNVDATELNLLNNMVSVSTGVADNDKFVTQGYVNDQNHITDGTADGQFLFWDTAGYTYTETSELVWDDVNKRLGVGIAVPLAALDIDGGDIRTQQYLNTGTNTNIGADSFGAGNLNHVVGADGYSNTAFGVSTLYEITTGYYNTAIGGNALDSNTSGYYNTGVGRNALSSVDTGYSNTAVGMNALNTTTGDNNVAIGVATGSNLTTGTGNILIGNAVQAPTVSSSSRLNIGDIIYADMTANHFGFDIGTFEVWPAGNIAMQLGASASIQTTTAAGNFLDITQNAYEDAGAWRYQHANTASLYSQEVGTHRFYATPTGGADAAITWTRGLEIDSLGVVSVGDNERIQMREPPGNTGAYSILWDNAAAQQVRFSSIAADHNYIKPDLGLGGITDSAVPLEVAGEAIIPSLNSYIGNGHFEIDASGWACTGNLSIARNTSSVLFGRGDGRITAAVNSSDDYCRYAFTLKGTGDLASMLSARIEKVKAGTGYDTGDASLRLYDVTAGAYINNNSEIWASTIGMPHDSAYQTHATNGTYQLRIVSNVDTTFTFDFDNIGLRRDSAQKGTPSTDWEDFTPVWSSVGVVLTVNRARWRQDGPDMIIQIRVDYSSGTGNATTLEMDIPNSASFDTTGVIGGSNQLDGSGYLFNTGKQEPISPIVNSNKIRFAQTTSTTNEYLIGSDIGSAFVLWASIRIPIAGWQAEASQSSTTLNRDIAMEYSSNGGETITVAVTDIPFSFKAIDAVNTWDGDEFALPEDGRYEIEGITRFTAAFLCRIDLYINGVHKKQISNRVNDNTHAFKGSYTGLKGEKISIRTGTTGGTLLAGGSYHWISISKVNTGTEKLFKDAKVYVYAHTSIQNIPNSTSTTFVPTTKVEDSHDSFVSGVFSAPDGRDYKICHHNRLSSYVGWALNELLLSSIITTNHTYTSDQLIFHTNDASASGVYTNVSGCVTARLEQGDTAYISLYQTSGSGIILRTGISYNWITIESE